MGLKWCPHHFKPTATTPLVHPLHLALIGWLAWTPTMAEKKCSLLLKLESSLRGMLKRIQPIAAATKRRDCLITPLIPRWWARFCYGHIRAILTQLVTHSFSMRVWKPNSNIEMDTAKFVEKLSCLFGTWLGQTWLRFCFIVRGKLRLKRDFNRG